MAAQGSILDVPGLMVGHAQDLEALTGCTVVLCPDGAVAGVDVRGSAPGTRETDLLDPVNLVDVVHAVLLTGGSAFGLDAAAGVMRWLEERGHGFETEVASVPIVPAAVLFDLALGRADRRPDAAMGYEACEAAVAGPGTLAQGNVGAGTGASAGKLLGQRQATKTGVGSASLVGSSGGLVVGAIVAANPFGDIRDPDDGRILAGARDPACGGWLDTAGALTRGSGGGTAALGTNTTIGVVATNAALTKSQARKVAQMAHDGLARAVSPVHTMWDGDTIFALSYGRPRVSADPNVVGVMAARAVALAVREAALRAEGLGGLPGAADDAADKGSGREPR